MFEKISRLQAKSAQWHQAALALAEKTGAIAPLVTSLALTLLTSGTAAAAEFTFTKIVDTNTPIPGWTGNFFEFADLSLDKGNVVFYGVGTWGQQGIYTTVDEMTKVIADRNTPIPGGTGNFTSFSLISPPLLRDGKVVFGGSGIEQQGIYIGVGGSLNVVADRNTPIPGGTGNFLLFSSLSLDDDGTIAFAGYRYEQAGVYTNVNGVFNVVADRNTPMPGGSGNFTSLVYPSLDNGSVAFRGNRFESNEEAICITVDGVFKVVADLNTPIPGGTGNFTFLNRLSLDDGNVAFVGSGSGQQGIYTNVGGTLNVIADRNTPIPGGTGNFTFFSNPLLDNGNVVFNGNGQEGGIYTNLGGSLTKVAARGDVLDNKIVSSVGNLGFSSGGGASISGEQIAFIARFTDGSKGIYIATLDPESSWLSGMLEQEVGGAVGGVKYLTSQVFLKAKNHD